MTREKQIDQAGVGRPSTLQDRIENFVASLANMTKAADIKKAWKKEFGFHKDRADTTKKLYTSKYRKAIKGTLGENHKSLKYIKTPEKIVEAVREAYNARVATENRTLTEITNWKKLVEVSEDMVQNGNPIEIGMGLMLLTGRRPYEVFCTGDFYRAKVRGEPAWHKWRLRFHGQAKTRGADGTRSDSTYEIPTLATEDVILMAYRKLRESHDGSRWAKQNNEEFTKELRLPIRNAMFRYFGSYWPADANLTPYCMRALYAEIAYLHFAPNTISKSAFFAKILGHRSSDIETSLSYMDYFLSGETEKDKAEKEVARLQARSVNKAKERGEEWAG